MFYRHLASLCIGCLTLVFGAAVNAEALYGLNTSNGASSLKRLDLETRVLQNSGSLVLPAHEHVASSLMLPNGELVLATSQVQFGISISQHLVTIGKSQSSLKLSGISDRSLLQSLVLTNEGNLAGLISENFGMPPFTLVFIDALSGEVSAVPSLALPPNQRFNNLTQCPDGTLYGTSQATEGSTRLVQIDIDQGKVLPLSRLTLMGKSLRPDLSSLACSASGQLYAVLDQTFSGHNRLFTVDISTGSLEQIGSYNFEKVFFTR